MSREKKEKWRRKGSMLAFVGMLMCVLIVVALVILMSSPVVSGTYGDVTGAVIDKGHAVMAALAVTLIGVMTFVFRHYIIR